MTRIFISYSRVDRPFVDDLAPLLRRVFDNIWFDEELSGGQLWWNEILNQIEASDVFLYLLSAESVNSPYCQAEQAEARRLQKPILPVMIRARTAIPDDLQAVHYIDLSKGVKDTQAITNLYASVNRLMNMDRGKVDPVAPPTPVPITNIRPPARALTSNPVFVIAAIVTVVAIAGIALNFLSGRENANDITPSPATTEVIVRATETASSSPFITSSSTTVSSTPSATASPIQASPTQISATNVERTVQAEMQEIETEAHETEIAYQTETPVVATAFAQRTIYAQETEFAYQTATATLWTPTETPDTRKTAEARVTLNMIASQTQVAVNMTATAAAWTDTPTPTPTHTPTSTFTPSNTPTATSTLTDLERASTPVAHNADWTPVEQEFNGLAMLLVPAGQFQMGDASNAGPGDGGLQIFATPFWISKTEVTNAQYKRCVDAGKCELTSDTTYYGDPAYADHPVVNVSWLQAMAYAEWWGMQLPGQLLGRLPTEAEWEYAARGPDDLKYPWGNEFDGMRLNFCDKNCPGDTSADDGYAGTAPVGSYPDGGSWVGALDLSGNVLEWVSSVYQSYPYDPEKAESITDTNNRRLLRGGAFQLNQDMAAAAFRFLPNLIYDWNYYGFRLVCGVPSP